ncbi:ABC transporter permease subunit [Acetobacter sicerae]|uniref:ABC transporter permease subunit n=1 Tax=Acetobacter sicerae TaxID=85325 RepID=UPI00156BC84D|nr:ABC transporter permease subunit [Acetobacter sicerae]NHN90852.1 ABC transporter permease subunit [Acetobacter sicerae]
MMSTEPSAAGRWNGRTVILPVVLLLIVTLCANAGNILPHWLVVWPREAMLPLSTAIGNGLDRLARWHVFAGITVKDMTRALAGLIAWPANLLEEILVDGVSRGTGAAKAEVAPPLSWLGVSLATVWFGWRRGGVALAGLALLTALYLLGLGLWQSAMQTLALLGVAVPFGLALGFGAGVILWRQKRVQAPALLILDQLQTIPIFAYLVPLVGFFGLGSATAILATVIFTVPIMARTTVSGLTRAETAFGEVSDSMGCRFGQRLFLILVPAARQELLTGVNQVIMLSFSCTVLASLVGTAGLGYNILIALRQLNIGRGLEAGLGVTILAILLDRFCATRSVTRACGAGWLDLGIASLLLLVPTLIGFHETALTHFPDSWRLSSGSVVDNAVEWVNVNLFWLTDDIKAWLLIHVLMPLRDEMQTLSWSGVVLFLAFLGYCARGWRGMLLVAALATFPAAVGVWKPTMMTVYLCLISVAIATLIGLPVGIVAGKYPRWGRLILTTCDLLQTLPAFVYLIPVIMFFGSGDFSAFVAVVVFAMCPVIRFTALGIREVPLSLQEAGRQLGMTEGQMLRKVELPMAHSHILLGVNFAVNMALAMLVVTALIGTRDLGRETVNALSHVDPGQGLTAGLAVASLSLIANQIIGGFAGRQPQ